MNIRNVLNPTIILYNILFFLIICLIPQHILGIDHSTVFTKSQAQTIQVVADKMIVLKDTAVIEFVGNVKVTLGDAVILANSVKIYLKNFNLKTKQANKSRKDSLTSINKIISTGQVEYISSDRKAFADKAVYTTNDQILILTGSPRLLTGKNWVEGEKITLFRKESRAIVEGDNKRRVQAFLNPTDK